MFLRTAGLFFGGLAVLAAQAPAPEATSTEVKPNAPAASSTATPQGAPAPAAAVAPANFIVDTGTRIPLNLINSISTKNAAEGDRVYLETVFPIVQNGKVVIPPGSYVAGTVTQVKRPGRVHGRGELYVRFDSLTLPNGVTRDFRARIGGLDGRSNEELDKAEGKVRSEGNKSGDLKTVAETAGAGATIGSIAGVSAGHAGMGAGIGAAAGAAAGLVGVLLCRGPDAVLAKGTTIEMVLDRPLAFTTKEVDFSSALPARTNVNEGPGPLPSKKQTGGLGRRSWPF
jgi:type IV secretion system protein VirB10